MPPTPKTPLDDDAYVARLLAEDARKSSANYAAVGLSALLPKRPTNAAPRPNTKFLKSLMRETDSHNAALKRREEAEARRRLGRLREGATGNGGSGSRTHASRDEDGERSAKRRRVSGEEDGEGRRDRKTHRHTGDKYEGVGSRKAEGQGESHLGRGKHSRHRTRDDIASRDHGENSERRRTTKSGENGRQSRSTHGDRRSEHRTRHRRRSPSISGSSTEDLSPQREQKRHRLLLDRDRNKRRRATADSKHAKIYKPDRQTSRASSSDPLEDLVGPLPDDPESPSSHHPTPRIRGRGAHKLSSTSAIMDSHFAHDYDPEHDVNLASEPEEEREDWDMALEALRDRQMWKTKHAERLREAGFDDGQIEKWEKSGKEREVDEVRFIARGKTREWDVGKREEEVEDEEGDGVGGKGQAETGWKKKGGFVKSFKVALG